MKTVHGNEENALTDGSGRGVSYLRLSVTDRCNLNCLYCRSKDITLLEHSDILTYEDMLELARVARSLGVEKIRLTGGEPFARPNFMHFLEMLARELPDMDVRITTNGTLLKGKIARLKDLGVTRLNVSLDTLDPSKFQRITGKDAHGTVLDNIHGCLDHGLSLKLNIVAMRGLNDDELPDFLNLALDTPMQVRFIEFMPVGAETPWNQDYAWPLEDILARSRELVDELEPLEGTDAEGGRTSGPARVFRLRDKAAGRSGTMGVISALSKHFCNRCNRLRITSDGRLRTCLFSDKEYRLRAILRSPKLGPAKVRDIMRLAVKTKPMGYKLLQEKKKTSVCRKGMSAIGG